MAVHSEVLGGPLFLGTEVTLNPKEKEIECTVGTVLGHLDGVVAGFADDGAYLYTATLAGTIVKWDIEVTAKTDRQLDSFKCKRPASNVPLPLTTLKVREGKAFIGTERGETGIWDVAGPEHARVKFWTDHEKKVSAVLLQPKEALLYSIGHDGHFRARHVEHDKIVHGYTSCQCPLSSMVVAEDETILLGSWEGRVVRLDLRAKTVAQVLVANLTVESPIRAMTLAPLPLSLMPPPKKKKNELEEADPRPEVLFVAHGIGGLLAWDFRVEKPLMELYVGNLDVVNDVMVQNDFLYSGGDDCKVHVFDVAKGHMLHTLTGHTNGVSAMHLFKDQVVTGSFDRSIRVHSKPELELNISNSRLEKEEKKKRLYEEWLAQELEKNQAAKKGKKKKGSKGKKKK